MPLRSLLAMCSFRRAGRVALFVAVGWASVASLLPVGSVTATGIRPSPQPPAPEPEVEAVFRAVRDGEMESVRAALDGGFGVDRKAPNGMTALHVAAVLGRDDFVALLIERGADVNDPAQNGITPLNRAAMGGHLETMRRLLAAGAEVDAAGRWGATPLLSAVDRGRIEAVRLLLAAGADPTRAAANGETAVSIARKKERREILDLLAADPETLRAARVADTDRALARAATHYRTGVAYDDAGDIGRAVNSYRLALEQDPKNPEINYRLGRALHRLGEREALWRLREAVLGWEAALDAGGDLPAITRPALEDACEVLRTAAQDEAADRCAAALARLPPD